MVWSELNKLDAQTQDGFQGPHHNTHCVKHSTKAASCRFSMTLQSRCYYPHVEFLKDDIFLSKITWLGSDTLESKPESV